MCPIYYKNRDDFLTGLSVSVSQVFLEVVGNHVERDICLETIWHLLPVRGGRCNLPSDEAMNASRSIYPQIRITSGFLRDYTSTHARDWTHITEDGNHEK